MCALHPTTLRGGVSIPKLQVTHRHSSFRGMLPQNPKNNGITTEHIFLQHRTEETALAPWAGGKLPLTLCLLVISHDLV